MPEEVQEECKLLATVSHPFVLQMVKSFETLWIALIELGAEKDMKHDISH